MISVLSSLFRRRPAAVETPAPEQPQERTQPYTLVFQWSYGVYAHLNPVIVHVDAEDELNALCDAYRAAAADNLERLAAHGHYTHDEDLLLSSAIDVFTHVVTFAGHHEPVNLA